MTTKLRRSQQRAGDLRGQIRALREELRLLRESITVWYAVSDCLPDDSTTVLLHAPDSTEPVWLGYYDAERGRWMYVDQLEACGVTDWADVPYPMKGHAL